jgi:hypothetical protein
LTEPILYAVDGWDGHEGEIRHAERGWNELGELRGHEEHLAGAESPEI